jgi:hypothetical protein
MIPLMMMKIEKIEKERKVRNKKGKKNRKNRKEKNNLFSSKYKQSLRSDLVLNRFYYQILYWTLIKPEFNHLYTNCL